MAFISILLYNAGMSLDMSSTSTDKALKALKIDLMSSDKAFMSTDITCFSNDKTSI